MHTLTRLSTIGLANPPIRAMRLRTTGGGRPGPSNSIRALEILGIGGERLQRFAHRFLACAQCQRVGQPDAPVGADAAEGSRPVSIRRRTSGRDIPRMPAASSGVISVSSANTVTASDEASWSSRSARAGKAPAGRVNASSVPSSHEANIRLRRRAQGRRPTRAHRPFSLGQGMPDRRLNWQTASPINAVTRQPYSHRRLH